MESFKLLGIIFNTNFTWKSHCAGLCSELSSLCYLFRRLYDCLSRENLLRAYYGIFHCRLCYGILLWGHSSHADDVFRLQRRVVRIIAGADYRSDCRPLFNSFNILTVPALFLLHCAEFVRAGYASGEYSLRSDIHGYDTRRADRIHVPYVRLLRCSTGINYYGLRFFNNLPPHVRLYPRRRFKLYVKNMLLSLCPYDKTVIN